MQHYADTFKEFPREVTKLITAYHGSIVSDNYKAGLNLPRNIIPESQYPKFNNILTNDVEIRYDILKYTRKEDEDDVRFAKDLVHEKYKNGYGCQYTIDNVNKGFEDRDEISRFYTAT